MVFMRILVDVSHPAHVHLFRHAISIWKKHGHQVTITARAKDITLNLLDLYNLDYEIVSRPRPGATGMLVGLFEHDFGVYRVARAQKVHVLIGTSIAAAHAGKLLGKTSLVFNEDNVKSSPFFAILAYPFASYIATPDTLGDKLGRKQLTYPGYHELAYLHPNQFSPDKTILTKAGLSEGEPFSLVRFVSLQAAHDVGQKGIPSEARRQLLETLTSFGKVFITSEGKLAPELERYRLPIEPHSIHDLLAFASIFVGDSQTMAIEAAVLGVPSVRYNSFVGRTPVIEELEHRYQLTFGFRPPDASAMLAKVTSLIAEDKAVWNQRRHVLLSEKIDLTSWMVKTVEDIGMG